MTAVDEAWEAVHRAWTPDQLDAAVDALIAAVRAEADELRAALSEVYDRAPGPWLVTLSYDTQQAILNGRPRRVGLGRGRVTNPDLDQRLKRNRGRAALEQKP